METQEKQHLAAATLPAVTAGIRAHLTPLSEQIAAIAALIAGRIESDAERRAPHDLLRPAPVSGRSRRPLHLRIWLNVAISRGG